MPKKTDPTNVILEARTDEQRTAIKIIKRSAVSILYGPAGTGKTHLPVVLGLQELFKGQCERLIFTRPCVEAYGEKLGFLPGDFNEKISPYMMPIFDVLKKHMNQRAIESYFREGIIQTVPLAFQRGLTFDNAFVVLDEAQNTVPEQIHMFLTRMGQSCRVVMTGDPAQSDIRGRNGLVDAIERIGDVEDVGVVYLSHNSIVRHHLVELFDKRYKEMLPSRDGSNRPTEDVWKAGATDPSGGSRMQEMLLEQKEGPNK